MGFSNVHYLIGGVENWKKTGYPLAAETAEQDEETSPGRRSEGHDSAA